MVALSCSLLARLLLSSASNSTLGTPAAGTLACFAGTRAVIATARARRGTTLMFSEVFLILCLLIARRRSTRLPTLDIRQAACLSMDIADLLVALGIESSQLLARRGAEGLFEVGRHAAPSRVGLFGDTVALIETLGFIGGLVLGVEGGERVGEAGRHAVLVVQRDRPRDGVVRDHVPVRQVLGHDPRAGLVFLRDVVWVRRG